MTSGMPKYQSDFYRRDDLDDVLFFIEQHPLAVLIPDGGIGGEFAFLPLILDPSIRATPVLFGHLDNHNPFLKHIGAGILHAVFPGPNSYISPRDYVSKQFPTWNYAVAQVSGSSASITDDGEKLALMVRMIELLEADNEPGYRLDTSDDTVRHLLKRITFFRLQIGSVQARFKFSQDKGDSDRRSAAESLLRKISAKQHRVLPRLMGIASTELEEDS